MNIIILFNNKDFESNITAEPITEESTEALDFIFDLYNKTFISRVLILFVILFYFIVTRREVA